ncbi:peptidylprolyl isomerase [Patescibacteria group bacterium]|nr:peptidylprolyl isomerase [Patescibacteria group bacterium]MCG2701932.1 peptidylprolyl isomerase [Candidatus Parcubacteria bacterium]MBU4265173.1 peptidylprolyl isomerase [Patescibacteria group bacterium]MBU4390737.1 peptidylprolyl isomerase [Patescibacteria group bacterium]MBU4396964.1 peptidylprolyl isomerase [Patescibacteria group bacterium]
MKQNQAKAQSPEGGKAILILPFLASLFFLSACTLLPKKAEIPEETDRPSSLPDSSQSTVNNQTQPNMPNDQNPIIGLKTKNGQIIIKLYADKCPNTVKNFLEKVNSGFYDNLKFHRVIDGFMAQGGDPLGTGTGGGKQKSELNNLPFVRGSLGLARTADTKEYSNDSQFFICFKTEGCRHLTNDYVNFGEVVSGLEILDQIQQDDLILEITTQTK